MAVCALVVVGLRNPSEAPAVGPEDDSPAYQPVHITKEYEPAEFSLVLVQLDQSPELVEWADEQIFGV